MMKLTYTFDMLKTILQIDYGRKSVYTMSITYTQKDLATLETMAENC